MEVTNTNSNSLAPKLGSVSKDTISGDAFSSHLREAAPNPRPRSEERTAQRDERSEPSSRAEAAENRNEAQAREADADARDKDHERHDENARNEASSEGEGEGTALQAAIDEVDQANIDAALVGEDVADEQGASFGDEVIAAATDATTESADTNATASDGANGLHLATGDIVSANDTELDPTTIANSNSAVDTATAQAQEAQEEVQIASAANIATSEAANTSSDKPAVNLTPGTSQTSQSANANIDNGLDPTKAEGGLPNPLGTGTEGDTGAKGDGEKGLGQQAAENMADKNNGANNSQTSGTTQTAAQAATPQVSAQALTPSAVQVPTSFGLNATTLPADLDLDLLNLNGPGTVNGGSSPQNSNATLVRFGALPGQAQATQVPNTAIALQIAKHVSKGVSTFEIRLDPAEMGRIDVKLELGQDGRVTALLAVEKPETLDLLQRDAKALEQALKDAGLDVDSDALNFSLQDGDAGGEFASNAGEGGEANGTDDDGPATTQDQALVTAMAARQIDAAARGGIDVSI